MEGDVIVVGMQVAQEALPNGIRGDNGHASDGSFDRAAPDRALGAFGGLDASARAWAGSAGKGAATKAGDATSAAFANPACFMALPPAARMSLRAQAICRGIFSKSVMQFVPRPFHLDFDRVVISLNGTKLGQ